MRTRLTLPLGIGLLALSPAPAQAQAQNTPEAPVLSKSDINALRKALADWYKTDVEANDLKNEADRQPNDARGRRKAARLRNDASKLRSRARKYKEKFKETFAKRSPKSGDLLKHVGDLIAIFDGCFPYPRQSNGGVVKEMWIDKKAKHGYAVRFPRAYKTGTSWPLIYAIPTRDDGGEWAPARKYLEDAWPKTAEKALKEYIVVCPMLPEGMDLDTSFDPTKEDPNLQAQEQDRTSWLLGILGDVFRQFQIHTDRVYLDVSPQATRFSLRLATLFPDRFAGLILNNPSTAELDDATALENLNGTGVLLVANDKAAGAAKKLEEGLKAVKQNVQRIEAKGVPPFAETCDEQLAWLDKNKRNLFRSEVVIAATHDRFRKAFWVEIVEGEYLSQVALSERPRVEVKADREKNRIEIKGRNVTEVRLWLNDLIVDLDKKITLVLNGQIKEIQRSRSLRLLSNSREGLVVKRNDPRYIFVTESTFDLPQAKTDGNNGSGGEGENGRGDR